MTPKQAKYLKGIAKGRSKKTAALEAGYAPAVANNAKANIEAGIAGELGKALDRAGLSNDTVAKVYAEALTATRPAPGRKGEVPDHGVRLKAAELVARLRGHFDSTPTPEGNAGASDRPSPLAGLTSQEVREIMLIDQKRRKRIADGDLKGTVGNL